MLQCSEQAIVISAVADPPFPPSLVAATVPSISSGLSAEVTSQGTQLMEQFLHKFAQASALKQADHDVNMEDESDALRDHVQGEIDILRQCYEELKDQLDESEWVQTVLKQTY